MRWKRKIRRYLVAVALIALAAVGLMLGLKAMAFLRIDSCLDAGGSWHYDRGECDFEANYEGPRS